MKGTIKIALAEDHELFRKALILLLREFEIIEVIHEVGNGKELLKALKHKKVDIVLLDINMPDMNGYETLNVLKESFPQVKVIMLSIHAEKEMMIEFIAKGANGYLAKSCSTENLFETIEGVYSHGYHFKQNMTADIIKNIRMQKTTIPRVLNLTSREIDVLKLICKGKPHKQIADTLFISLRTVDFHKSNIYKKTNTNCTAKLYEYALANDLISKPVS